MNLYLLMREDGGGYDEFDAAVVCAESEEAARLIHPDERSTWDGEKWHPHDWTHWPAPSALKVEYLGAAVESLERAVVLADFCAG